MWSWCVFMGSNFSLCAHDLEVSGGTGANSITKEFIWKRWLAIKKIPYHQRLINKSIFFFLETFASSFCNIRYLLLQE